MERRSWIVIAVLAMMVIAGTPIVAGSGEGYTKRDMVFFAWVNEVRGDYWDYFKCVQFGETGSVAEYAYAQLEIIFEKKLTALDRIHVSENVEPARTEYKNYLIGMRDFARFGAEGAPSGDEHSMLKSQGSLSFAEECLGKYFTLSGQVISEGLAEEEDEQLFLISPCEAISISAELEQVQTFISGAEHLAQVDIYLDTRYLGKNTWLVVWTNDKSQVIDLEAIHVAVDIETGEVLGEPGTTTGWIAP